MLDLQPQTFVPLFTTENAVIAKQIVFCAQNHDTGNPLGVITYSSIWHQFQPVNAVFDMGRYIEVL